MKNIYTFGRRPAQRNYTVKDLIDLKKTGERLTMCNPANEAEIQACVDAGIDLLTLVGRASGHGAGARPHPFCRHRNELGPVRHQ